MGNIFGKKVLPAKNKLVYLYKPNKIKVMKQISTANQVFALKADGEFISHMDIYEDMDIEEVVDILITELSPIEFIGCEVSKHTEYQQVITINEKPVWVVMNGAYYNMFMETSADKN